MNLLSSRRKFLADSANGVGALALASMLPGDLFGGPAEDPLAPKAPHFPAKAKSIIYLFMVGGPSHIETFDPKPLLTRLHGQPMPPSFGEVKSQFVKKGTPLMGSQWKFNRYGQSGLEISDLMPNIASCADDLAVIRSCYTDSFVHAPAMYQLLTSRVLSGHPSLGSWVTYGLGSENANLPAFCVMTQPEGLPEGGSPMWSNGYLPSVFQGTQLRNGNVPILNLAQPEDVSKARRRKVLDFLKDMNSEHNQFKDSELEARIASYELAFRMQQSAPEAVDLSKETRATKNLYGLDDKETTEFGTRCLLARRLVERGVRVVLLFSGGGPVSSQWDAHDLIQDNHTRMSRWTDKPIAGLLKDLKSRGLLDTTLVVWASEFGRTPVSENGKGRDHNPEGFTIWMAGGGVKGGQAIGQTDELGFKAQGERYHPRDINATILNLMGLDQWRLTFLNNGRNERLTDFGGTLVKGIS